VSDRSSAPVTDPDDPIRVLIVDDDFRVADIHRGFVEELDGFVVVGTAQTGAAALEACTELNPDLVLLDIYLPDGLGTDVIARLRTDRSVDCFVLTAARDIATVKRCLDLGALNYLIKPFKRSELTARLKDYRRWKSSWRMQGELDQRVVDRIFHGVGRQAEGLPKGLSAETMELVIRVLAEADEPLGADDVAQLTGISRVSVRRYLRHLTDRGQAVLSQDYGTPGRPRHRFALAGS
jgi:response regulator of citrate/malate metabolism